MIKAGLLSITFRHLNISQIVNVASRAQLDALEWGWDIHVPPGDRNAAKQGARVK